MSPRRRSGASRRAKKASSGTGGESIAEPEGSIAQESIREVSTQHGFTTGCEDDEASAFGVEAKDLQPEEPVEGQHSQMEKTLDSTTTAVDDANQKRESEEESIEQAEGDEGVDQENSEKAEEKEASLDAEQTGNAHPSISDPEADSDEDEAQDREANKTEGSEMNGQAEELASEESPVLPQAESRQLAQMEQPNQQQLPRKNLQMPPEDRRQRHEQQPHNTQEQRTPRYDHHQQEEGAQPPQQQQLNSQQEQARQEEGNQRQQLREAEDTAPDAEEDSEEEKQQEGEENQDARGAVPQELQEAATLDFSGFVRDVWEESELEFGVAPSPSAAVCCDGRSARNVCHQDAKALVCHRIPAAVSRYTAEAQQESVGDACLSCTGDMIDGCLPTTRLLSELLLSGSAALASLLYTYRCEICRGLSCLLNSTFNCLKMCVCVVTPPPQEPRPAQRLPSINWVSLGESTELWAPLEAAEFDRVQSTAAPRLSRQAIVGASRPAGHPRGDDKSVAEATGGNSNAASIVAARAAQQVQRLLSLYPRLGAEAACCNQQLAFTSAGPSSRAPAGY
ncbi:hypothetical protein Emag_003156 [Eimeria magna]